MNKRRSINTRIWSDEWFETLNPMDKLLWVYLFTNPHTNMLGIYEITMRRISFDTGLKQAGIEASIKAFESLRKAYYVDGFMILVNFIKNQSMNTNMITSAKNELDALPNSLKTKIFENDSEAFESLRKGMVTLRKIEDEREGEGEEEEEGGSQQGESTDSPTSEGHNYLKFIAGFNEIKRRATGSVGRFQGDEKSRRQYRAILKHHSKEQVVSATTAMFNDKHHIDTGWQYCTPEFITRPDKFARFLEDS